MLRHPAAVVVSVLALLTGRAAADGIIDTYAGGGPLDGGSAGSISIAALAVTVDRATGDLLVTDLDTKRILRVSAGTGTVTTLAGRSGGGPCGSDIGDGGPAASACLHFPERTAVDGAGNVFIADSGNHRIRRVDATTGLISTVAGGGPGPRGDGGPATAATLVTPFDVAFDSTGNLYVADLGEHRVRRVDATTGIISTFMGVGGTALAFDAANDLYLADIDDPGGNRVLRRDAVTGTITVAAGNGTYAFCGDGMAATAACLYVPIDIALDGAGNLYIVDRDNYRIRRVDATTGIISTIAGTGQPLAVCPHDLGEGGPATSACLGDPYGIDVDSAGNVLIADYGTSRVRRIDAATQTITTVASNGDPGFCGDGLPATAACLDQPYGVAFDGAGNLFVADTQNGRIRRVDAATQIITTVAGSADGVFVGCAPYPGDGILASELCLTAPTEIGVDLGSDLFLPLSDGRVVRIDAATERVSTVAGGGTPGFCGDGGPATGACLDGVVGLTVDAAGDLYLADGFNARIRRVDAATGDISTVAGNGDPGSCGDGGLATAACIGQPVGVALDPAGNLFISDFIHQTIRRVDAATGIISTIASGFEAQVGIAADVLGNVFVADGLFVYRIDAFTQATTVVAGSGAYPFCGDGGPATSGCFGTRSVAVRLDGTLMIADVPNDRVRRVRCTAPDSDGDGVCDEYDFTGALGLTGRTAAVQESGNAKKIGRVTIDGNLDSVAFPPLGDAAAFFAHARQSGVAARVLSTVAPPALASVSALQFTAAQCRFSPAGAVIPTTLRCTGRGASRRTGLRLRRLSATGTYRVTGKVRDPRIRVPPTGPLVVLLSANDTVAERYQATASSCSASTSNGRKLACTGSP